MGKRNWYALYNPRGLCLWGDPRITYYSFSSKAERDAWVADDDGEEPKKMEVFARHIPAGKKIHVWTGSPRQRLFTARSPEEAIEMMELMDSMDVLE